MKGYVNILTDVKEYGKRAEIMKKLYREAGFKVVYDKDGTEDVADGFLFHYHVSRNVRSRTGQRTLVLWHLFHHPERMRKQPGRSPRMCITNQFG